VNRPLIERWYAEQIDVVAQRHPAQPVRLLGAALLAGMIFMVDSMTSLGSAVAVVYAIVVFLVGDAGRTRILATSAGCACLTLLSFACVHGFGAETQAVLRLLFSLSANVLTTVLVVRSHRASAILIAQARLLELSSDAILLKDDNGHILYWSSGAEQLYGWPAADVLGRKADEVLRPSSQRESKDMTALLTATNGLQSETKVTARDGRQIDVFTRCKLQPDGSGRAPTVLEISTDITERKRADEALKASELRFRTIFETLPIGIWEHDFRPVKAEIEALRRRGVADIVRYLADNPGFVHKTRGMVRITDVNQTALAMMGVRSKQEFFTHLDQFLPDTDDSFSQFLVALAEGRSSFQSEATVRGRHGNLINIIITLNFPPNGEGLDRVQGSVIDVTERRAMNEALERTRRELEQASRSATVGEISASIAHEVNQPLAAVVSCAQAAQRWLARSPPDMDEANAALADVVIGAERAADVVKRVRMLLGKAKSDDAALEIDLAVADAIRLKRHELTAQDVQLSVSLRATGIAIRGDRVLLQQALLNIINNAAQAMEAVPAHLRKLRVSTEVDGDRVSIVVTDSGPGLQSDSPEAAFKPFWTTKADGMGLGLAMCRSIATAHGGTIHIGNHSESGGARVSISLPRANHATTEMVEMTA
jgi:PAS domain S-box-containing protein